MSNNFHSVPCIKVDESVQLKYLHLCQKLNSTQNGKKCSMSMGPKNIDESASEVTDFLDKVDEKFVSKTNDLEVTREVPNYDESFLTRKDVKWKTVFIVALLHAIAVYTVIAFPYIKCWKTALFGFIYCSYGGLGVTAGVHRYWSHKSYKANIPLRIFLMIAFVSTGEDTIYLWVRNHRTHHKYSETDADPYNSTRGFWFSHVGWLLLKRHPEVLKKKNQIDMSDIENEPVAAFSNKHYRVLSTFFCYIFPLVVPVYFWNETWLNAALITILRQVWIFNITWSVNSFAHLYGNKPYDKNIAPVENKFVSFATIGEGWHNYHHTFPYDYRAAEIGGDRNSFTTRVIDFFAKIGWAYDLKSPSESLIKKVIANRGDKNYLESKEKQESVKEL